MVKFDEDKHEYRNGNGILLPSVTQICRFLNFDVAINANPYLKKQAAEKGTAIHQATMLLDYGEPVPDDFPEEWLGYIESYNRFIKDFSPQWYGIERIVSSEDEVFSYAGTIDRYGKITGKNVILDIKTGSKLHFPSVAAQLQGYEELLYKENFEVDKLLALQLGKDGIYKLYDLSYAPDFFHWAKNIHFNQKYKGESI